MDQSGTASCLPPKPTEDRSALLSQLKIDRGGEEVRPKHWPWVTGTLAIVAAVGAGTWFLFFMPAAPVVQVAMAQPATANAESVRNSALDASGYVVARRAGASIRGAGIGDG